jgi:hypothetical protein
MVKDVGIVQGSAAQAVPLVVGVDTVYVHTDIMAIPVSDGLFSYHEVQYGKDEYIQLMAEKNIQLERTLTDTQLALCEIYEGVSSNG